MKKILVFMAIAGAWLVIGTIHDLFFSTKDLGGGITIDTGGNYTKVTDAKHTLNLRDILDYKYDDRYILLLRMPVVFYECKDHLPVIRSCVLEYMVIDKKEGNRIFTTRDVSVFKKRLNKLPTHLAFSSEEIQSAQQRIDQRSTQCMQKANISGCRISDD